MTHDSACASRFWMRVNRTAGPDGCWPWLGSYHEDGYGWFWCHEKNRGAHRVAFELASGVSLPSGVAVRHFVCDNPPCVNPAHLRLGTNADNVADKVAHSRQLRGETHPARRLDIAAVRDIRSRYPAVGLPDLAAEYGVTKQAIWQAAKRRTWRDVE